MAVQIEHTGAPISLENLHDLTDVLMGAIHKAFDGQVVDAAALSAAFILNGLAIMKDAQMTFPKERAIDLIRGSNMDDIHSFKPSLN